MATNFMGKFVKLVDPTLVRHADFPKRIAGSIAIPISEDYMAIIYLHRVKKLMRFGNSGVHEARMYTAGVDSILTP